MNSFTYRAPTNVIFGKETEAQVGSEIKRLGGSSVLVIYGSGSVVKSGLLERVTASLEREGLTVCRAGGVKPNPLLEFAQQLVTEYKDRNIDFILGVGGGSVLDTAKAVAIGLAQPKIPIWDYYLRKAEVAAALPVGAVLTIAAAGSETSDSAVLTREETGEKRGINTEFNRPAFAIMNPELTYTLPTRQTVCGVVDIIMHTLDRYFSTDTDNATTDGIAEAILRAAVTYGAIAMEHPLDYKARSELMWCGSLSHNGITGLGQPRDFSVHALGHELSGMFDLSHGESLSIMWPAWAKFSWKILPARFAQYGRNVWGIAEEDDGACAQAAIAATKDFFQSLGAPVCFSQASMGLQSDEVICRLAKNCSFDGGRVVGQFYPMKENELYEIYMEANQ